MNNTIYKAIVKDINNEMIDALPADQKTSLFKAHAEWNKAEKNIPEHEYQKGYRYRQSVARKKWDAFRNICIEAGLEPARTGAFLNI